MRKRIFMFCCAVFVIALSLLTGCATTTPSPENMAEEVSGYNLPKQSDAESSLVYVVRPSSLGTLVRFNVFLDDKEASSEMGWNRGSQYIYFYVNPGKHTVFSNAENWAEISIDVKAGETVFVEQIPAMGFIMARNSLEHLSEVKGKYYIKHASLGTIVNDGLSKIKKQEIKQDIATQPKTEAPKANMEKLDKLREGGVISADEYNRAKEKITPQTDSTDTDKKLEKLGELRKSGVLSEEDYNKAKKRLTELQKLNELRQSGVLSAEEYNKAKERLKEK